VIGFFLILLSKFKQVQQNSWTSLINKNGWRSKI
jgi:hypothetical protein